MFLCLGNLVARHWIAVILIWLLLVLVSQLSAPRWEDIAYDGNFAYLPSNCPSVVGEKLLAQAFARNRFESQMVVVVGREEKELSADDVYVANDLARRFRNLQGVSRFAQGEKLAEQAVRDGVQQALKTADSLWSQADEEFRAAIVAFEEAIRLDRELVDYRDRRKRAAPDEVTPRPTMRLAAPYYNLARVYDRLSKPDEAATYRKLAIQLDPSLATYGDRMAPAGAADWPLSDVWTWHDEVVGSKLISQDKRARLIILHLSNEFIDTDNIRVLEDVEAQLASVREDLELHTQPGLTIGLSGSAAVGGDMLRAARDSIRHTELFTIVLVVLILAAVYRSPLLIVVPLVAIGCSYVVATGIVAVLTQLHHLPGFGWWDFKVFTTTKIFIVVILYGSGTDFCLFLISRYKEELGHSLDFERATAASLAAVGDALAASALTTIVGLSMMFFAQFGKFSYSGPVIGLCLTITLAACVTLAPAILRACGRSIYWPSLRGGRSAASADTSSMRQGNSDRKSAWSEAIWQWIARPVVARPGLILTVCVLVMLPLGVYGVATSDRVTYDFLSSLSPSRPSRQGAELLRRHFPIGESGPVTLLIQKDGGQFDTESGRLEIANLAHQLYLPSDAVVRQFQQHHPELTAPIQSAIAPREPNQVLPALQQLAKQHPEVNQLLGVAVVRSISDPLGTYPPGRKIGILSRQSWRTRLMRPHKVIHDIFVAQVPTLTANIARFELLLRYDPFSIQATEELNRIDQKLNEISREPDSYWHGASIAYAGTTAAIRDLRDVTRSDNVRIQILVVLAVSAVLLTILKRPIVCAYMMASVLFSYFVTFGVTQLFFVSAYGDTYQGLDWKVPVFLFVILVAVGQDYNVYLATRVFEEQRRYGPFMGLRRAVTRTGGIITSCGVIMAGSFISMTSATWGYAIPDWVPFSEVFFPASVGALRSMVELGFALSFGVMLDTFVVRPILLPAFLAMLCRWQVARSGGRADVEAAAAEPDEVTAVSSSFD